MRNAASLSRDKIRIYAPDVYKNEYGEQVQEYKEVYKTGAAVDFVSGSKETQNNIIVDTNIVIFTVRQYVPVESNYIIYYNNNKYQIDYINYRSFYLDKQIKCTKINE